MKLLGSAAMNNLEDITLKRVVDQRVVRSLESGNSASSKVLLFVLSSLWIHLPFALFFSSMVSAQTPQVGADLAESHQTTCRDYIGPVLYAYSGQSADIQVSGESGQECSGNVSSIWPPFIESGSDQEFASSASVLFPSPATISSGSSNPKSVLTADAIVQTEYRALVALYSAMKGGQWKTNFGPGQDWDTTLTNPTPRDIARFRGVTVSNGSVTRINLERVTNHGGTIPPELENFSNLTVLNLARNNLSGSIPSSLGNLSKLTELRLDGNRLTGSIPSSLGSLSKLQTLDLRGNKLSGSIPSSIGNLSELTYLDLGGNLPRSLTGHIPSSLGNLSKLQELKLDGNRLTSIPKELGKLSALGRLDISGNALTGSIPKELCNLSRLHFLDLGNQTGYTKLTGGIPACLGGLSNLNWFDLGTNRLSGSIPPELGKLSKLNFLYLHENNLSGTIPAELGQLKSLRYLVLASNVLSGVIPSELGGLSNLEWLSLEGNRLSGRVPASLGDLPRLRSLMTELPPFPYF